MDALTDFHVPLFQHDLLYWFERNLRDLPWRQDRDPYKIWVSEIMLQQTRVDTVIPYFTRFMERFPSIEQLAVAEEDEVLKMWEGLGYYSRARNLHAGVREVQEKYGGIIPNEPVEISTLKGVGPYTAGAILSIAYGRPEPAVDGNVMRVLSRLLVIKDDIQKVKTRKQMEDVVRGLISHENPSFFNQALMELGALICTPKSPKCTHCPVAAHCQANRTGVQEELPIKGKSKPPKELQLSVGFLYSDGKFFIRKRSKTGLLAGLWELPNQEGDSQQLAGHLHSKYGISSTAVKTGIALQHVFSHLIWNMEVYSLRVNQASEKMDGQWISFDQLESFAFPVSFQKILKDLKEELDQ